MKRIKNGIGLIFISLVLIMSSGCSILSAETDQEVSAAEKLTDKEIIDGIQLEEKLAEDGEEQIQSAKRKGTAALKGGHKQITVSAVGDVLIHDVVYNAARTGGGYDFRPMLKRMKPYFEKADIVFANQETMIGGAEFGLSSYPRFNSPFDVGDALADAGVDVVSLANNHTLDKGETAIMRATEHWTKLGITYVGAYRDEADRAKLRILETKEGIRVAFLAYTYGTNGLPVPKGKSYLVNLIDKKRITEEMNRAKEAGADAIVLSLHFGDEYAREPNEMQEELVRFAADNGADVVLGHHPHVLQPVEWVKGKNGRTLVVYSLGNFISGQLGKYKQTGGMLTWDFIKKGDGTVETANPRFMPTWVTYGKWTPEPLYKIDQALMPNRDAVYTEMKQHMSKRMSELKFYEK